MAYQNVVGNRLAQAETTTGYVTIYTTPLLTRTYVKNIDICNTTSGSLRFYVHLIPAGGTAGSGNALFFNAPIAGNTTVQWTGSEILTPGDLIQIKGSAAGISVTITGGEAT
jgi:hypothetical protein